MIEARLGDFSRSRQQVIGECRGQRLAVGVERHLLIQRGANALRKATIDLAIDHHRIDELAAVLDDDVVQNFDIAEFGIHRNGHGMRRVTKGAAVALRLVADGGLQTAAMNVGRCMATVAYGQLIAEHARLLATPPPLVSAMFDGAISDLASP